MPTPPTRSHQSWRLGLVLAAVAALLLAACEPAVVGPNANPVHPTTVGTNPDDRTPHILDGQVYAILDLGTRVIVGGEFTQVKRYNQATVLARRGLFAYDKATGAIETTFVPVLDRGGVRDMVIAPDGTLIIGGSFRTVNGGPDRGGLAKISPTTGALVSGFSGSADGWVNTMALRGDRLFLGGTFGRLSGATRSRLGAINARTGAVDPVLTLPVSTALRGTDQVWTLDATKDGKTLVIIGNFTKVGTAARVQVAIINVGTSSSTLSSWSTNAYRGGVCSTNYDFYVKDVDISPDDRYFAIVTTGAWRGLTTMCDTVARWELGRTGGSQLPTWTDYTGGDSLIRVSITGAAVYAAGHQRWANNENAPASDTKGPGAVDRPGIAAYAPATGAVLPWTVDRERGLQVGTLTPTDQGLWIGSDSSGIAGEWHPRLTFIPLP